VGMDEVGTELGISDGDLVGSDDSGDRVGNEDVGS